MLKASEVVGKKFGRLTAKEVKHIKGFGSVVICMCICGNERAYKHFNLLRGSTKSCGCLWLERKTTHRMTGTRVYGIWRGMKSRCRPNSHSRADYYDRGIKVCKRWQKFENFYEDMGDPPDGLTLERENNDKGYSKSNCKWATYTEQLNNRRNSHLIEAFGTVKTLTEWAREYNLPYSTLKNRLYRAKLPPEIALNMS